MAKKGSNRFFPVSEVKRIKLMFLAKAKKSVRPLFLARQTIYCCFSVHVSSGEFSNVSQAEQNFEDVAYGKCIDAGKVDYR